MSHVRNPGRHSRAVTKMRTARRGRVRPLGQALEHPADRIEDRRGRDGDAEGRLERSIQVQEQI